MAIAIILFKASISRIPLLLFGQHQVLSQSTQHLRCSDPDRFFMVFQCFSTTNCAFHSFRIRSVLLQYVWIQSTNMQVTCAMRCEEPTETLPLPSCCRRLPAIWHIEFNPWHLNLIVPFCCFAKNMCHLIWDLGWLSKMRTWVEKKLIAWSVARSLSAQRQSYLGETIGQMDQHEHCPLCLQGNQTKLASSKHGVKSEVCGLTLLKPMFG